MTTKSKGKIFIEHIERHLAQMPPLSVKKKVICKICGKSVDQIYSEENRNSLKKLKLKILEYLNSRKKENDKSKPSTTVQADIYG